PQLMLQSFHVQAVFKNGRPYPLSLRYFFASSIHSGIFCLMDSNPYFSVSRICSRTDRLSRFLSSLLKYSFSFNVRFSLPCLSTLNIFAFTIWPFDRNWFTSWT